MSFTARSRFSSIFHFFYFFSPSFLFLPLPFGLAFCRDESISREKILLVSAAQWTASIYCHLSTLFLHERELCVNSDFARIGPIKAGLQIPKIRRAKQHVFGGKKTKTVKREPSKGVWGCGFRSEIEK